MNWRNLKSGLRPNCNYLLSDKGIYCICNKCKFRIRQTRLKEILENKKAEKYQIPNEQENLEKLNSIGAEVELEEEIEEFY